jgi:hypothetical protein
MRRSPDFAGFALVVALFASRQEPPWCFRFPGESTARCNYYSFQECLIGARVIGGKCERFHALPGQLTPAEQPPFGTQPRPRKTGQPH